MKDHLTQESNPIVIGLTLCTKRYIKIKVYCKGARGRRPEDGTQMIKINSCHVERLTMERLVTECPKTRIKA